MAHEADEDDGQGHVLPRDIVHGVMDERLEQPRFRRHAQAEGQDDDHAQGREINVVFDEVRQEPVQAFSADEAADMDDFIGLEIDGRYAGQLQDVRAKGQHHEENQKKNSWIGKLVAYPFQPFEKRAARVVAYGDGGSGVFHTDPLLCNYAVKVYVIIPLLI